MFRKQSFEIRRKIKNDFFDRSSTLNHKEAWVRSIYGNHFSQMFKKVAGCALFIAANLETRRFYFLLKQQAVIESGNDFNFSN